MSLSWTGHPENGGRNLGVRPMEMLLLGLGGCSNFDVVSILKKSRQAVDSCEAFVEAERASEDPRYLPVSICVSSSRVAG